MTAFPLAAQTDSDGTRIGIAIGDVPRVKGLRLNFRDRNLQKVDGMNVTIWNPHGEGSGIVRGVALGLPITGAGTIDGLGIGILGVGARDRLNGVAVGLAGVGSGGDINGVIVGGIGAGSGHDMTGIGVGGIGLGSGGSLRGIFVGGIGLGAAKDLSGLAVGGIGVGTGGDVHGVAIGGVGVGSGGTLNGIAIGGVGVGAVDLRGIGVAGFGVGAKDAQGAMISAGWNRIEHGTLRGLSVASFNQLKGSQRGLAIGIVNYAEELHGVQIGLVNIARNNRSGARVLPILNVHTGD